MQSVTQWVVIWQNEGLLSQFNIRSCRTSLFRYCWITNLPKTDKYSAMVDGCGNMGVELLRRIVIQYEIISINRVACI